MSSSNKNNVNKEHASTESLEVPINTKNWLISPPPSPPLNWRSKTEGKISHTLPFFDLPAPKLIQETQREGGLVEKTFLLFSPFEPQIYNNYMSEEDTETDEEDISKDFRTEIGNESISLELEGHFFDKPTIILSIIE